MRLLLILALSCSCAFSQTEKSPTPDQIRKARLRESRHAQPIRFDIRDQARITRQGPAAQARRLAATSPILPILKAEYHDSLRITPNRIGAVGLITHPSGGFTEASSEDPATVAGNFLRHYADTLSGSGGDSFEQTARRSTGTLTILDYQQTIRGLPVFGGHARLAVNAAGQITRGMFGEFAGAALSEPGERLSPEQAAIMVLARQGRTTVESLEAIESEDASTRFVNPLGAKLNPIHVTPVAFPMSPESSTLAYRVLLDGSGDTYDVVLDASNGQLLYLAGLRRSAALGRVWKIDPGQGSRELVDFPDEWFSGDGTMSTGNNADAYRDWDGDAEPDDFNGEGVKDGRAFSAERIFDFPGVEDDPYSFPEDFPASAITNAFYNVNRAHDYFYGLGFTEGLGNFQQENPPQIGVGGDPVHVEVHQMLLTDVGVFRPTPDGVPPRLMLGIMLTPDFDFRDAALVSDITFHEYTHGVTSRILGGPKKLSCTPGFQSAGLDEGWADYFSLSVVDNPIMGAYLSGRPEGIRRQSLDGYTFTYEDLGNDGFDAPHDEGEIWAATLWDIRKQFGTATTDQLAFDALTLTPCEPSMIAARDAILDAAAPEQQDKLWEIFAARGMGFAASGVDGWSLDGTTFNASYDLPPTLSPGNRTPTVSSFPDLAEDVGSPYSYRIRAQDADGDPLSFELLDGPDGMTLDPETGDIDWVANFTGARAKVKVSDGNGGDLFHGVFFPVYTTLKRNAPTAIYGKSGSTGYAWFYFAGADPILQFTMRGGTGDADLFVFNSFGDMYESFNMGNDETLTVPNASTGPWFVRVRSFEDYSNVALTARSITPTAITPGELMENLSDAATGERFYTITIPEDAGLVRIRTYGGDGDVDLFGRRNGAATCQSFFSFSPCLYDEKSWEWGNDETITLTNPAPGEYQFTLYADEAYSGVTLVAETFASGEVPPIVGSGGVVLATQTPVVSAISPNAVFSIYGTNLAAEGTSALQPGVDGEGRVATTLANTCVEIDGHRSAMFAVLPTQINAQASSKLEPGTGTLVVIQGCGTESELRSPGIEVSIQPASPAFFNFINNTDGDNPLAALHGGGPALVGAPGILPGAETSPAAPGEYISLFGTGFGATDPPLESGEIPLVRYPELSGQAPLTGSFSITVGGVKVPGADIYYVGAAPCCAGLQQFIFKIGERTPTGNHIVIGTIDGVSTPRGPYITVTKRQ